MRISKAPEERKREMIDTAMKLFGSKGYESTTMSDIAKEMNVVPGLCYRYFRSKEELYHEALNLYAQECAGPIIQIMDQDYNSLQEYVANIQQMFRKTDGKEKYHDFFHKEGNEMFHSQLEYCMLKILEPEMAAMLQRMKNKGLVNIDDCRSTALFILHGEMPIINDDSLKTEEKLVAVMKIISKILK